MGSSDQFGSSDEDDDDEGWLTQSTFGLNPPVTTRPFSERRPLSSNSNGFGVSNTLLSFHSTMNDPQFRLGCI